MRFNASGKTGKVCLKNIIGGIMYEKENDFYPQEVLVEMQQIQGNNIFINRDVSCFDSFHNGLEDNIDCGSSCSKECQ